jgi:EpsI family protein
MFRHHPFRVSVVLLVIAGAVAYPIAWGADVGVAKVNLDQLPRRILGFDGRDDRFKESVYRALNADYHLLRQYRGGGSRNVWLYIGYYGTAKGGRPSHVPQSCYTGQGFSIVEWTTIPSPIRAEGPALSPAAGMLNKMHVKRGNTHQLVLFWYQSKNRVLADGIEQNLQRLKNRLLYNRDDGAFVRLSTTMNLDDEAEAEALLQGFAVELLSLIPSHWPEEGPARVVES